jgi:hypothetical protein
MQSARNCKCEIVFADVRYSLFGSVFIIKNSTMESMDVVQQTNCQLPCVSCRCCLTGWHCGDEVDVCEVSYFGKVSLICRSCRQTCVRCTADFKKDLTFDDNEASTGFKCVPCAHKEREELERLEEKRIDALPVQERLNHLQHELEYQVQQHHSIGSRIRRSRHEPELSTASMLARIEQIKRVLPLHKTLNASLRELCVH